MFSRCLYGKLGWEIVGKSDINIRIKDKKIKVVRFLKKEKGST
jgi:hypothetical protein